MLSAVGDVADEVEGPLRLEAPVHQHVRVQAEHLQVDEVAVRLEQVALDLRHVAQAQPTRGLVDDVERHLREERWRTSHSRMTELNSKKL